ncbi:MAG: SAM-dependent methyltransferase [Phycisphaerales bacterium]
MFKSVQRITYQVPDVEKAKQWYRMVLEREPSFDAPFFVCFAVGDTMLALVPTSGASSASDERIVAHWGVEDADAAYKRLLECGAAVHTEIGTVQHMRAARVIDPFGNVLGIVSKPGDSQSQSVENRPSDSAMGVTMCRALAAKDERQGLKGRDCLAEIFLTDEHRKLLQRPQSREYIIQKMVTPALYGYILARTIYMDQIFEEALQANVPQIVWLGAGYDSRAYRFEDHIRDTRLFELDIQTTQQRKRQLLERANVPIPRQLTFVPINFKTQKIDDALRGAGFDKDKKTLFLWEGVTYYLSDETVHATLDSVRRNTVAGSTICFDYMTQHVKSVYAGEPFLFWIDPGQLPAFLSERGYAVVEHLDPGETERRYLTFPDGSPIGKTLPFFSLVRAAVSG